MVAWYVFLTSKQVISREVGVSSVGSSGGGGGSGDGSDMGMGVLAGNFQKTQE